MLLLVWSSSVFQPHEKTFEFGKEENVTSKPGELNTITLLIKVNREEIEIYYNI